MVEQRLRENGSRGGFRRRDRLNSRRLTHLQQRFGFPGAGAEMLELFRVKAQQNLHFPGIRRVAE